MHTPTQDDGANGHLVGTSPPTSLPAPPRPSADPGVVPQFPQHDEDTGIVPEDKDIDIFTLTPIAALKMLCASIEGLVNTTGDVPPTPPISIPTTPVPPPPPRVDKENQAFNREGETMEPARRCESHEDTADVPAKSKTPIGSPEAHPAEPLPIIESSAPPRQIQHDAITRKFYSKKPPPIPLEEYLLRLHKYCPMSTGVYLATSLYIHRLAVVDRLLPVTTRNVHRLLLAGLRVAMKALEDLSYPHRRFAKVGGVTEVELGRLEISFCFLTNFELRVTREVLDRYAVELREEEGVRELRGVGLGMGGLRLGVGQERTVGKDGS